MGSVKVHYSQKIRVNIKNKSIRCHIVVLFGSAYSKVETGEIAANGFHFTLWTLNINISSDVGVITTTQHDLCVLKIL